MNLLAQVRVQWIIKNVLHNHGTHCFLGIVSHEQFPSIRETHKLISEGLLFGYPITHSKRLLLCVDVLWKDIVRVISTVLFGDKLPQQFHLLTLVLQYFIQFHQQTHLKNLL